MPFYNNTLFPPDHIIREYILVLRDESLKLFLDDGSLRSIGSKTSCYIELTNRILNRRVASFKLVKYAIVKIAGVNEPAIRQCNRLLEHHFPPYRHRKEYQKRVECCTLFSQEFIPDNSSLYFPFQRTGASTYQYGNFLVKSPYEQTVMRPNFSCQWRLRDADLSRGITITEHRQVETYLSYYFKKCNAEQKPYDPKMPVDYVYDDLSELSVKRSHLNVKECKKDIFSDYIGERTQFISSMCAKKGESGGLYDLGMESSSKVISHIKKDKIKTINHGQEFEKLQLKKETTKIKEIDKIQSKKDTIHDGHEIVQLQSKNETVKSINDDYEIEQLLPNLGVSFTDMQSETVQNAEYISFHPNTLIKENGESGNLSLVSKTIQDGAYGAMKLNIKEELLPHGPPKELISILNSAPNVDNSLITEDTLDINHDLANIQSSIPYLEKDPIVVDSSVIKEGEFIVHKVTTERDAAAKVEHFNPEDEILEPAILHEGIINWISDEILVDDALGASMDTPQEQYNVNDKMSPILDSADLIDKGSSLRRISQNKEEEMRDDSVKMTPIKSFKESSSKIEFGGAVAFEDKNVANTENTFIEMEGIQDSFPLSDLFIDEILRRLQSEILNTQCEGLVNENEFLFFKEGDVEDKSLIVAMVDGIKDATIVDLYDGIPQCSITRAQQELIEKEVVQVDPEVMDTTVPVHDGTYLSVKKLSLVDLCVNKVLANVKSDMLHSDEDHLISGMKQSNWRDNDFTSLPFFASIMGDITDGITNDVYEETRLACERFKLADVLFMEPVKNPSATLITRSKSTELTSSAEKASEISKIEHHKLTLSSKKPDKSSKANKDKEDFFKKLDKKMVNMEMESSALADERFKDIIYKGSGINRDDVESIVTLTSADRVNTEAFQRNENRMTSARSCILGVVNASDDTSNITSSRIWEAQTVKRETSLLDTAVSISSSGLQLTVWPGRSARCVKNHFQIINIEHSHDIHIQNVELVSIDANCYKFINGCYHSVINVDSCVRYEKAMVRSHCEWKILCFSRNTFVDIRLDQRTGERLLRSVEIEDPRDRALSLTNADHPQKLTELELNETQKRGTIHELSSTDFFTDVQSGSSSSMVLTLEEATIKETRSMNPLFPNTEATTMRDSQIIVASPRRIRVYYAPLLIERFGQLSYFPTMEYGHDVVMMYSEVLITRSPGDDLSMSSVNTAHISTHDTDTLYGTIQVDKDVGLDDQTRRCMAIDHADDKKHLLLHNDVKRYTDTEVVNYCPRRPDKVHHQSMADSRTQDTLVSSHDSVVHSTGTSSVERTYLRDINKESHRRHINANSCKQFQDNADKLSHFLASHRDPIVISYVQSPSVKRTLLDLSKELHSRKIHKELCIQQKPQRGCHRVEHAPQTFEIQGDARRNVQIESTDDESSLYYHDSLKKASKSRTRTLSDKIIFKARKIISKLYPMKKIADRDTCDDLTSMSRSDAKKMPLRPDFSSLSSFDSLLSKNSLSRYWNIRRLDSVKRIKVKYQPTSGRPCGDNYFPH